MERKAENETLAKELMSLVPLLHKNIFRCHHKAIFSSVPPKQMQTLMVLSFEDTLNMTQLTERVGVSKQQLTQLVDGLVERGLAQRMANEENRRVVLIQLTDAGRYLVENMVREKGLDIEHFFGGFTGEERTTVLAAAGLVKRALIRRLYGV